jgi:hypothetical protein
VRTEHGPATNTRRGVVFVGLIVAVAAAIAIAWVQAETPRSLERAWATVVASVRAASSSLDTPWLRAVDAGAPVRDGGVDAGVSIRRQTAPLSSAQLGAPLVHGAFVSACGAPDDMKVIMKVSVKMGRAVDVAAETRPPNPVVESCLERKARELQWDISPKTDHVTVTY